MLKGMFGSLNNKEFINLLDKAVFCYNYNISYNSYGEFLFISLAVLNENRELEGYTFYGLGYHEYRRRYITETWEYYKDQFFHKYKRQYAKNTIPISDIKQVIIERQHEIEEMKKKYPEKPNQLYEFVADLTDEDAAITLMEEFGL